jgi:hypothetical protein
MSDRTREATGLERMREDALVELSAVAPGLTTVSARAVLRALIAGERGGADQGMLHRPRAWVTAVRPGRPAGQAGRVDTLAWSATATPSRRCGVAVADIASETVAWIDERIRVAWLTVKGARLVADSRPDPENRRTRERAEDYLDTLLDARWQAIDLLAAAVG